MNSSAENDAVKSATHMQNPPREARLICTCDVRSGFNILETLVL